MRSLTNGLVQSAGRVDREKRSFNPKVMEHKCSFPVVSRPEVRESVLLPVSGWRIDEQTELRNLSSQSPGRSHLRESKYYR